MAISSPRDIPGLLVWYSAEAETSYADGAVMSGWTDLSGNGNHATIRASATPTWFATGGASGGPRVNGFASGSGPGGTGSGGGFMLPAAVLTGLTAAEAAITIRPETTGWGPWNFGSDSQTSHFGDKTGGLVYDEFGTTARKSTGIAPTMGTWYRYAARSKAGAWTAWLDGVQKYTTATNTVGWVSNQAPSIGDSGSGLYPLNGSLGAFVLYNRELTTAERADLDSWLQAHPSGGTAAPAAVLISGQPFTAPASLLDGTVQPGLVAGEAFAAQATMLDGATAMPVRLKGEPFGAIATAGDGIVVGAFMTVTGESFAAPYTALSGTAAMGSVPVVAATDSVNRANGMTLVTEWDVEVTPPVALPKRTRGHDYARAISTPTPTLVNGRPT